MPTPRKNEAKQDYLKRCTEALIQKENRSPEQAYKLCNVNWDNAKGQKSALSFTAPIELTASEEGGQRGRFLITAYTGKVVQRFWSKLVIVVKGIQANGKMPILREHFRDRVVGWSVKSWADGNFYIMGEFSESAKDGQEVRALAEEGFPWQASIGVWPVKVKVLDSEKEEESVNGLKVTGPAEIWLESEVREVSFVAIGADSDTAAIAKTESEDRKVPGEIITNSAKEEEL